jgi:hypothetical protein
MIFVPEIKCGWKWLETQLNRLGKAINARTIIVSTGGGIDIQETSSGTLLSLSKSTTSTNTDDRLTALETALAALTDRVATLEAILATATWTGVDVVDSSCVHSTINVLTKP